MLLIIDTSKPTALVAFVENGRVVAQRSWENDRTVGRKLLQKLDEVLAEAGKAASDIQRVAVHEGPGSYSWLRSGVVCATILAYTWQVELVGIRGDSLEELIKNALQATPAQLVKPVYNVKV